MGWRPKQGMTLTLGSYCICVFDACIWMYLQKPAIYQKYTKKYTKNISKIYKIYETNTKQPKARGPCAAPGLARAGPGRAGGRLVFCSYLEYLGYLVHLEYIWIFAIFWYVFWYILIYVSQFANQKTSFIGFLRPPRSNNTYHRGKTPV